MGQAVGRHDPYYHAWWAAPPEEERRFRIILWSMLLLLMLLGLVIPFLPTPKVDHAAPPEVPPRLARLILERRPPPPPPEVKAPQPEKKPEPKPEEKPQPEKKAPPKPKPETKPKPARPDVKAARRKAARSGLLALRSELAALRSNEVVKKLERQPVKALKKSSTQPQPVITAPASALEKEAVKISRGIDTSKLSRDTGDTRLAEHEVVQMVSPGDDLTPAEKAATRTNEEIKLVFDQNKGRLNTLYNRALRKNPALAGKVILKLTIAPSGEVTACEVVSSELGDPVLERKLVARVLLFDFGPKDVPEITINYPLEFYPG